MGSQTAKMTSPVRVIVVGAGSRGENYSNFASVYPERMKVCVRDLVVEAVISDRAWVVFILLQVVAVADPRKFARTKLAKQHSIQDENMFEGLHRVKHILKCYQPYHHN